MNNQKRPTKAEADAVLMNVYKKLSMNSEHITKDLNSEEKELFIL